MVDDLNLNAASRQIAVNIFNTALESPESFQDYATQFYNRFYSNPQLLEFLLDILFKVSNADGRLSRSEEELIRSAAEIFQFSTSRFENIRSRYVRTTDRSYSILGCSPTDTDHQIKSSYRKLVREFHPDTVTAKGLPDEFTAFAHEKFREIQQAYEAIKKERGIK
jgi:DnaJ like chaperone protein